jgi:putative ubiquitin-RnfH superfamily antitoxin RatB of RatAB toxin-antitoxin module
MKVEVVRAWPRRFERIELELPTGASVADALHAGGIDTADQPVPCAVFGVNAAPDMLLHEGDRIELLRPLRVDPKEARRRRAVSRPR